MSTTRRPQLIYMYYFYLHYTKSLKFHTHLVHTHLLQTVSSSTTKDMTYCILRRAKWIPRQDLGNMAVDDGGKGNGCGRMKLAGGRERASDGKTTDLGEGPIGCGGGGGIGRRGGGLWGLLRVTSRSGASPKISWSSPSNITSSNQSSAESDTCTYCTKPSSCKALSGWPLQT